MAVTKTNTYNGYKPPFTLSAKAVGMIADTSAQIQNTVHKHKGAPLNAPVNGTVNGTANKTQNTIIKVIKGCSINSF